MQIAQNTVVSIDYTLTDDNGEVIDSSQGREPLTYVHGSGQLIPGLESALEGQSAGDDLEVKVAPDEAYGERDERLVQAVPRAAFQGVDRVELRIDRQRFMAILQTSHELCFRVFTFFSLYF